MLLDEFVVQLLERGEVLRCHPVARQAPRAREVCTTICHQARRAQVLKRSSTVPPSSQNVGGTSHVPISLAPAWPLTCRHRAAHRVRWTVSLRSRLNPSPRSQPRQIVISPLVEMSTTSDVLGSPLSEKSVRRSLVNIVWGDGAPRQTTQESVRLLSSQSNVVERTVAVM